MSLTLALAIAGGIAWFAFVVWLRWDVRRRDPVPGPPLDGERRAEHVLMLRLLEGLDTLDERYHRFVSRVLIGLAVMGAGVVVGFAMQSRNQGDIADLAHEIVDGNREACARNNAIRQNQVEGITDQLKSTDEALKEPLGALESFREKIVKQRERQSKRLARLLISADEYPDPKNPYLVDCRAAHP